MSLESSVANVLRQNPVAQIGFRIDMVVVDKLHMEKVAKAIEKQELLVEVGSSGAQLGASYSSWKGRRFDEGEKKALGRITVGSAGTVSSPVGRAAIFHESVHALVDVQGWKVTMHNDEVAAYLADALYLRATKARVSGGKLELAIYDAAFAVIDKHRMMAKKGVALQWKDCDQLRDAIRAHPAYE